MMRIIALNEARNETDADENEDGIQVTKEAEETIAVSEYMRALSFKHKGENVDALTLFSELLETRVLNEISFEDKNDKLFSIRYNCHKNLALIFEEKGEREKALEHFMEAMNLDDTEVYTMNRLGQLALELKRTELAQHAFEKCLAKNPNHWPAGDGILQVLCHNDNILGAYGWALKWYDKNKKYERAIDVLTEINEKFSHLLPFFKSVWKQVYTIPPNAPKTKKESVFPPPNIVMDDTEYMITPNLDDFKVPELTWLSIGKFIASLYNHLTKAKQSIIFIITVDDMLQTTVQEKPSNSTKEEDDDTEMKVEGPGESVTGDSVENANEDSSVFVAPASEPPSGQTSQPDSNAEDDSDNTNKEVESTKPKPRRRCSDLSFLEQWGWHKNRRYSSRKKSQQDRPEIDTTINGFLRRMLRKYFQENFDEESPFLADIKVDADIAGKQEKSAEESKEVQASYELFQAQTEDDFQEFLKELKAKNFDLIALIFLWLKYISKYWDRPMMDEIRELFHEIYQFYLNHYDTQTWNQLTNDEFNASFRMMLFFMELDHEKELIRTRGQARNDVDSRWKMLYHHMMFHSGFAFVLADDLYERNIIRLIWLDFLSAKFENDLHRSVECLLHLEYLMEKQEDNFKIEFPNQKDNNYLDLDLVRNTRVNLQRRISLNNVKNLYDNHDFESLIEILKDSMVNSIEIKNSDNTCMKIQTQIEVLLESFWNVDKFNECLVWSERSLKYSVDNLLSAPTDTFRYREWADIVNFIMIYIEELIIKQGYDLLYFLEKYQNRLVQSLTKILSHQLDVPFDKNNNPYHPVNIKRPWIILQQILQRDEDNSPVVIKVRNPDVLPENEDIEELIPHTILILFTAHESLGRRQWCTRDNGQLLLYTLDIIVPKLRAPFVDAYRDYVFEYLEQITYCLYGYPPKKPRSRHIEEHDASQVEMTWKRAIQLFDIYRPETLPEFNSYKGDSISADMEQLLLKILPLIPKEIDLNACTNQIRDFIAGKSHELPKPSDLLPQRISCIFYLLADYYFKSRDFSKTLKYYVLDLACEPTRFDSWAGLALSKASKLETKLNSCTPLDITDFLTHSENAQRCFEQCIKLNPDHTLFWIEYGSFAYTIHSFCSRNIKHLSDTLSMEMFAFLETRKEEYLNVAYQCFTTAEKIMHQHKEEVVKEETDSHDEKWLHHYMLGKIAEKRKEHPKVYLDHYVQAAKYLYENNAAYPFKINHNNPATLSIEALEVFYRTASSIVKYLEQHNEISREVGRLFLQVLKELASSPFACNQAKIDNTSIMLHKRKIAEKVENSAKQAKLEASETNPSLIIVKSASECITKSSSPPLPTPQPMPSASQSETKSSSENIEIIKDKDEASSPQSNEGVKAKSSSKTPSETGETKTESPSRRGSQESGVTTTTGTSSSTSSSSGSDSDSSDSSSSDSESGSSSDEETEKPDESTPMSESELEPIYRSCIRHLEECVTRFSEHYKSIYRLVNHYLHAPENLRNIEMCKNLLLGSYKTKLGNQIIGLFADRKNNNFFNGIWRIPSSEIDRPGSFSAHLVKCVVILLEVLKKGKDHKTLIDMAVQLNRPPDNDKRYIKEVDRKELCDQALSFCVQVMRDCLKQLMEKPNDNELLDLILDIFRTQKTCNKHISQKESLFEQILVDAYKLYVQGKIANLPENANLVDLAVKLCNQEISHRKSQEKQALAAAAANQSGATGSNPMDTTVTAVCMPSATIATTSVTTTKPVSIPGITSRPRGRPVGSKTVNKNIPPPTMPPSLFDPTAFAAMMYGNPGFSSSLLKDPTYLKTLTTEYYKLLLGSPPLASLLTSKLPPSSLPSTFPTAGLPPQPSTSSMSATKPQIPQFDMNTLMASLISQAGKSTPTTQPTSSTINLGSGELTITPTTSKPTVPAAPKNIKQPSPVSLASQIFSSSMAGTSVSMTKVPPPIPPISSRNEPSSVSQLPLLPDLPKSLTITPAPSFGSEKLTKPSKSSPQLPQMSMFAEKLKDSSKYTGKMKTSKKTNPNPYARPPSAPLATNPSAFPAASAAQLGNITALAQQMPFMSNFNLQNYNSQVNLLKTYADLLTGMGMPPTTGLGPAGLGQIPPFQMPVPPKRSTAKKPRTSKTQPRFNPPTTLPSSLSATRLPDSITAIPIPPTKQSQQSFVPSRFNAPPSKSPILVHSSPNPSPGLSPVGGVIGAAHQSISSATPPNLPVSSGSGASIIQSSPTKTLQQKLAERQKANALHESSAAHRPGSTGSASGSGSTGSSGGGQSQGTKKKDVDVIILD